MECTFNLHAWTQVSCWEKQGECLIPHLLPYMDAQSISQTKPNHFSAFIRTVSVTSSGYCIEPSAEQWYTKDFNKIPITLVTYWYYNTQAQSHSALRTYLFSFFGSLTVPLSTEDWLQAMFCHLLCCGGYTMLLLRVFLEGVCSVRVSFLQYYAGMQSFVLFQKIQIRDTLQSCTVL